MPSKLVELIYISRSHDNIRESELMEILAIARKKNSVSDITGMLTFDNAMFVQLLEGPQDAVLALFNKIKTDARHYSVQVIYQGEITERAFSEWAMAYKLINNDDHQALINKISFDVKKAVEQHITGGQANIGKELLLIYRDNH